MNKCLQCNLSTNNPKFCSRSCAGTYNNLKRGNCINKNKKKQCSCIQCGKTIEINIRAHIKTAKCKICKGKCRYCKQPAKYELTNGTLCCSETFQQCPIIKQKNSKRLKKAHKEGRIPGWNELRIEYNLDTAWSRGLTAYEDDRIRCKYDVNDLFSNGAYCRGPRKKILIKERGYRCEKCKNTEWLEEKITLELDHIDGNNTNNLKENLQLLCPNCHSQTKTWRGRNSNTGRRKWPEQTVIDVFMEEKNIYRTLIKLEMAPKGANYKTMYKLLEKYNILYLVEK